MSQRQDTLGALRKFNEWVISGGEHQAGLPARSSSELNHSVQILIVLASQLAYDLEKLRDLWTRFEECQSDALAKLYLTRVISVLHVLHLRSKNLVTEASKGSTALQDFQQLIQLHIVDDEAAIVSVNQKLDDAREKRAQARRDLSKAQEELQGDQGFLNGFLTGISFTIYNPIQENLEKADNAIKTYNYQMRVIKNELAVLNRRTSELSAGRFILKRLENLYTTLVDYLNYLTQVETSLEESHEDVERFEGSKSSYLSRYYKRQAGKEMDELFAWIDAFKSAR